MGHSGTLCACALICAIFAGCGKSGVSRNKAALRLYAGAGLRRGIDAVAARFAEKTGIQVEVDYGGSGMIVTRALGDPDADLFIPGDVWYVDILQKKSGLVEKRENVALFVPTIIVSKNNPKNITTLKDLFRKDVKTAIGNPDACQIGRLTIKLLKKNGLNPKKLNAKKSLTVNELGVWVRMRDVDTAIVWEAIAANLADNIDKVAIPEKDNIISCVVIALLKSSRNKEAAQKFMDFITAPEGREILRKNGFNIVEK